MNVFKRAFVATTSGQRRPAVYLLSLIVVATVSAIAIQAGANVGLVVAAGVSASGILYLLVESAYRRDRRVQRLERKLATEIASMKRGAPQAQRQARTTGGATSSQVQAPPTAFRETGGRFGTKSDPKPNSIALLEEVIPRPDSRRIRLDITSSSSPGTTHRAALVKFEFRRADGSTAIPIVTHPMHPKMGMYAYLNDGGNASTSFELVFPDDATELVVRGAQWKTSESTEVVEFSTTAAHGERSNPDPTFVEWLDGRSNDRPLVVIYSTSPTMNHPTLGLRPNRLAREYEAMGYDVVFLPFGRIEPGDAHYSAGIIQFERSHLMPIVEEIARRDSLVQRAVFICSSFPDIKAATAIDYLNLRGIRTIYEVRDEMEEFNRVGYSKWFSAILEMRVVRAVDNVVCVSPRLAEKMRIIGGRSVDVSVVPNGVAAATVDAGKPLRTPEAWTQRESQAPTVGYIGHLTPSWFDWPTLIAVARRLPAIRFEIIGHGAPEGLELPINIEYLGPRTHSECIEYVEKWRAGLIPFKPSGLTRAVDPNKIYEYLSFGLRTVTVAMGSVEMAPSTRVTASIQEMTDAIAWACESPMTDGELRDIQKALTEMTWRKRAEQMTSILGIS